MTHSDVARWAGLHGRLIPQFGLWFRELGETSRSALIDRWAMILADVDPSVAVEFSEATAERICPHPRVGFFDDVAGALLDFNRHLAAYRRRRSYRIASWGERPDWSSHPSLVEEVEAHRRSLEGPSG